jgi:L-amino acid N-acyltransferase YncA
MEPMIRAATREDLVRVNQIYNEYVVDSHTSFDTEPWSVEERLEWFLKYEDGPRRYQALVLEIEDRVVAFASSGPFRDKVATTPQSKPQSC